MFSGLFGVCALSRAGFLKYFRALFQHRVITTALIALMVLSACTPDQVLTPPGDIVSSVRPLYGPSAVVPVGLPIQSGQQHNLQASAQPNALFVSQPIERGTKLGPVSPQATIIEPTITVPSQALEAPIEVSPIGQQQNNVPEKRAVGLAALSNIYSEPPVIHQTPVNVSQCQRQLRRLGVRFETPSAVKGPGKCGIAYPVEVKSLSGGIDLVPDATLNCPMALAFAKWVKAELAPTARTRYLSGIEKIHQMSAYSCRTMNSRRGAPLSEHATGNAIDIGKISLTNGKDILVKRPNFFAFREKNLLHNVRAQSCKYFTTVLGPGSDVYHKDHFHFDLRQRDRGYRHCD